MIYPKTLHVVTPTNPAQMDHFTVLVRNLNGDLLNATDYPATASDINIDLEVQLTPFAGQTVRLFVVEHDTNGLNSVETPADNNPFLVALPPVLAVVHVIN